MVGISAINLDPNGMTDKMLAAVRSWTEVSREYTHTHAQRFEISRLINGITWEQFSSNMAVPAMQGAAIRETIKQLQIPKVSAISWDGVYMDRFALLGVEGNYTNGRARIYVLDIGSEVIVLASDLWNPTYEVSIF